MSDQLNALRAQAEEVAQCYDAFMPDLGLGDILRDLFRNALAAIAPPACDCDLNAYHRWNCALTPLWAQTMRDLDTNPWTATRSAMWVFEDILPNQGDRP